MSRTVVAEMRVGFAELKSEIRVINHRLDGLDTDVQAITRRLMDGPDAP